VISRVKRQGACGACWAITAAGLLESQYAKKNKKLVELSEQQILDCGSEKPFLSQRCDGGYVSEALKFTMTSFVSLRDNYPYLGLGSFCKQTTRNSLMTFKQVPESKEDYEMSMVWTKYYSHMLRSQLNQRMKALNITDLEESSGDEGIKYFNEQILDLYLKNFAVDDYNIPVAS